MKNFQFDLQQFALTATKSSNVNIIETYDGVLTAVPIVPGSVINSGDIIIWDPALLSGNGGARTPTVQADIALANGGFLGTSRQQSPVASLGDYLNNIDYTKQGAVRLHSTAAETYKMFTPVYWNEAVDVQTVTNVSTARTLIGYIRLPQQSVMQGVLSITGAANVDLQVLLQPKFPALII